MKTNTYIFSLLIMFSTLVACEQTIDLELPAYENEMVLYGVLIAGEQPQMLLTESNGYFEPLVNRDRLKVLTDAQVTLHDGTEALNLTYDPNMTSYTYWTGYYSEETSTPLGGYTNEDVIIEEDKTYSIEVKHQGRTITGETTVPKKVALNSATYEIEKFIDPLDRATCFRDKKEVNFDDADEENFYQLKASIERWSFRFCDQYLDSTNVELDSCSRGKYDRFYPTFSDETFNGTNYDHQLNNSFTACFGGDIEVDTLTELRGYSIYKFTLHSVSKEWFDFETSLDMQLNSEGNPFQEPSTIKSTVEGGTGVFASKSAASDTILLRVDEQF